MKASQKIQLKIYNRDTLKKECQEWATQGKKIVFTNGCFDILHAGHIDYLSKASELGDKLIIGVNSDFSVKRLKGKARPVNDENSRMLLLAALFFVDAVVLFDEDTPYELINELQPDILVKGGDYREEDIAGADIVKRKGGKIIILPFLEGFSTTKIIDKLKS
ncbi:MAG: D-glycero-beta-D-manno-heptose 1-phosphate adenylyltransferase [Sphingobacteriales bacterium]|nr:D-glycero-beta-D-manno-heptose 1-phosphate adenylyltransferase [Sphingobacteriales bacterium]